MKARNFLASTLLLSHCFAVSAQSQIAGLSPSSRSTIDLFESSGDATPIKVLPAPSLQFPLTIKDKQQGYLKIVIDGSSYWVRSVMVKISRDSAAACDNTLITQRPGTSSAAMPGVMGNLCK